MWGGRRILLRHLVRRRCDREKVSWADLCDMFIGLGGGGGGCWIGLDVRTYEKIPNDFAVVSCVWIVDEGDISD